VEKKLLTMLQDDVAMRRMARVIKSKGIFTKNIKTDGQTAQWTGEEGPISKGDGLKFAQLRPGYGYVSTWTDVSETMLDDADFNVSDMILEDSREVFAPSEEEKFLNGTGVESPKGLFNKTPVSTVDASRAFGTLQYIATGKADGFLAPTSSVSPADVLIELTETPKTGYLGRAQWLMSRSTRRVVRCFKDADGRFIYQTSMVAGVPSSLLGYGVEISDSMPSIAANTFPLAFGDFYRGYLIHDRLGMKVKIDPFAGPEYVDYYVRRIVGGTVMDSNAIKLLKVATS
jgi:HK97 family phage major capsid protein